MNDGCHVKGPPAMMDLRHIRKAWFGYRDTWIALTEDGLYSDLNSYYNDLDQVLDDCRRRGRNRILVSTSS